MAPERPERPSKHALSNPQSLSRRKICTGSSQTWHFRPRRAGSGGRCQVGKGSTQGGAYSVGCWVSHTCPIFPVAAFLTPLCDSALLWCAKRGPYFHDPGPLFPTILMDCIVVAPARPICKRFMEGRGGGVTRGRG